MPTVPALIAPPQSRLGDEVETIRRNLPIHVYLMMLHRSATEGYLPTLNQTGTEVSAEPVETQDRLKLLQYLTDKAMSAPKSIALPTPPPPPRPDTPVERLTEDELLAIVNAPDIEPARAQRTGEA